MTAAVAKLKFHISMSLDGFITGPSPRAAEPLGDGGEQLHAWMNGLGDMRASKRHPSHADETDAQVIEDYAGTIGALVMGKGLFDIGDAPWGDDPPWGMPVFVVTHNANDPVAKQGGTTYTFVTDGPEAALEEARAAAGDRDVGLVGGANLAHQYLDAGLLDELLIHLVPVLLGDGVRLFEPLDREQPVLETIEVVTSPGTTHLRFRVMTRAPDAGDGDNQGSTGPMATRPNDS